MVAAKMINEWSDNDDQHVHVHVCACVCMCVHVHVYVHGDLLMWLQTDNDYRPVHAHVCACTHTLSCMRMRMCVHVLIHCYSPSHLTRDGFR